MRGTESWVFEVNYPDFPLDMIGLSPGKHLIQFLPKKMQDFRNFVLHNCILICDAEPVYLKPQVTNVKNKEVIANPKPQTLKIELFFENPKPKHQIHPKP